jgi:tRNA_anti-like/GYF domain 2
MRWYVKVDGEATGPVDDHTVADWVREGRLGPATRIAVEGAEKWTSIARSPFGALVAAPAPPKGLSTAAKVLIAIGGLVALTMGTCGVCVAIGAKGVSDASEAVRSANGATAQQRAAAATVATATAKEEEAPTAVLLKTLLSEYKDNEVRADQQFKGQLIVTSGKVGDVKKDFLNHIYVTVGNGGPFEIPVVQCFPIAGQESKAAALSKGDTVTIQGRVDGLMMNVVVKDCQIGGT